MLTDHEIFTEIVDDITCEIEDLGHIKVSKGNTDDKTENDDGKPKLKMFKFSFKYKDINIWETATPYPEDHVPDGATQRTLALEKLKNDSKKLYAIGIRLNGSLFD